METSKAVKYTGLTFSRVCARSGFGTISMLESLLNLESGGDDLGKMQKVRKAVAKLGN